METKLSSEELKILGKVLSKIVIKSRTGELGIMHGADRFVSTQLLLKKEEIIALEQINLKIGNKSVSKIS